MMPITREQCRGARGMLGWSRDKLAHEANVAKRTIVDFENDKRKTQSSSILALKVAFENAGIEFLDSTNGGPGVRLRKGE